MTISKNLVVRAAVWAASVIGFVTASIINYDAYVYVLHFIGLCTCFYQILQWSKRLWPLAGNQND